MAATLLSRGDLFAGRYKIDRAIGAGGMGAVFEAEHLETERKVALKVLLPASLVSDTARERFKQEARVSGRIRHPYVVDVVDAGVDDLTAMPYLVMELLRGEDLGSHIDHHGPLSPKEAIAVLGQVACALDYLHERSIVHRDLKPANLFLSISEDGARVMKLLDFGVAKVLAEGKSSALTQDAQGTPVYMAPEQFAEQIRISPATDIYALGMVAFTLLTGQHYWGPEIERGMNVFMLARVAEAGPKEPATVRAHKQGATLPATFDDWFSIVTAISPGERYPTAGDAIAALADALGEPLTTQLPSGRRRRPPDGALHGLQASILEREASAQTPPIPLRRPLSSWRRPAAMTAALLVVAGVLAYVLAGIAGSPGDPAPAGSSAASAHGPFPTSQQPSAPEPSTPAVPQTAASPPAPSAAAPSPSATSSAASAPTPRPSKQAAPVPTKKPKYTRE
jgi:serine/threonine protein kinase